MPDLGLPDTPIVLNSWLAKTGAMVGVGEQLVELLAGDVLFQLPAEAAGILSEKVIRAEHTVKVGEVLGVITSEPDQAAEPS